MNSRKKYIKPHVKVEVIEIEDGLAVGSSRLYPGGSSDDIPEVNNWTSDPLDDSENKGFIQEW